MKDKFSIIYSSVRDTPEGSNFIGDLQQRSHGDFSLRHKGWSYDKSNYSRMIRYFDGSGNSVSLMPIFDRYFGLSVKGIMVRLGSQSLRGLVQLAYKLNLPFDKNKRVIKIN